MAESWPVPTTSAPVAGTYSGKSVGFCGLFVLLLSAWGGLVPFVGPLFGYSANGVAAWHWSLQHGVLYVVPGAAGVVAGLLALADSPRVAMGGGRVVLRLASVLAMAAGAWFVLGPWAWPTVHAAQPVFGPAPVLRFFANVVGYNLGIGILLVGMGALISSISSRSRARA
jgi:hypothetical protein